MRLLWPCLSLCLKQKLPKVNKELAMKLMEEGEEEALLKSKKKKAKVEEWCLRKHSCIYKDTLLQFFFMFFF